MLKKSILAVLAIKLMIVSLIVLNSCKKENVINKDNLYVSEADQKLINQYNESGDLHNLGLDQIFNSVALDTGRNSNNLDTLIRFYSLSYLEKTFSQKNFEFYESQYNVYSNDVFFTDKRDKSLDNSIEETVESNKNNISDNLENYFYDLDSLFEIENITPKELIKNILFLESKAIHLLKNKDLSVFMNTTSIAKGSLNYWIENFDKWQELSSKRTEKVNDNKSKPKSKPKPYVDPYKDIKAVAAADAVGALEGALEFMWLGGPAGMTTAAVGKGLIASSGAIVVLSF